MISPPFFCIVFPSRTVTKAEDDDNEEGSDHCIQGPETQCGGFVCPDETSHWGCEIKNACKA